MILLYAGFIQAQNSTQKAHPKLKCLQASQNIIIDGKPDEWVSNKSAVIADNTFIGLFRDAGNIYFFLETRDPEFSMQIMNFGLTTWLSALSSKDKALGIQFPETSNQPPPPKEARPPSGDELRKILAKRQEYIIIEDQGGKAAKRMNMEEAGRSGIAARIRIDSGILYYELRYPIVNIPEGPLAVELRKGKPFSLLVETPEVDMEKILKEMGEAEREKAQKNKNGMQSHSKPKLPQLKRISQWFEVSTD
ncbi:MAG: hypothetical protein ACM3S2_17880 [Ignavibacteriales bacterium]